MGASVATGVSMGMSGLGALFGAGGAEAQGQAQSQNMMYQAMVAQYNAQLDMQKAEMASRAGEVEAANMGMKTRAAIGQQRAAISASGVDSTTGSARDVQRATEQIGMMDAKTIRANAAMEAWGYGVEAINEVNQANANIVGAKNARKAGRIGAIESLISGASSVGNAWLRYQNPNMNFGI